MAYTHTLMHIHRYVYDAMFFLYKCPKQNT